MFCMFLPGGRRGIVCRLFSNDEFRNNGRYVERLAVTQNPNVDQYARQNPMDWMGKVDRHSLRR